VSDLPRQPEGLISVLLDTAAEYGDRDDAAMDLAAHDGEAVERALARVATDPGTDEDLADTCGQSLAEIWSRRNSLNDSVLVKLVPASLRIALRTLEVRSPDLAAQAEEILRAAR
jgi:hypothetical protein